jgi:hypothetical protein
LSAQEARAEAVPRKRVSRLLLAAAWLVPGLGHWLLGKRLRAAVFVLVVVASFVTGVMLEGELGTPKPGHPFSWLATFACLGNGLLYLARMVWLNGLSGALGGIPFGLSGGGDPTAAGFAYGNTFLYTAGLMNLLVVLDVADIARGEKS